MMYETLLIELLLLLLKDVLGIQMLIPDHTQKDEKRRRTENMLCELLDERVAIELKTLLPHLHTMKMVIIRSGDNI